MTGAWLEELLDGCEYGVWPDSMRWIPVEGRKAAQEEPPVRLGTMLSSWGLTIAQINEGLAEIGLVMRQSEPALQELSAAVAVEIERGERHRR